MLKLMISAAEVSGDVHGSYLVRAIKKIDPAIRFFGTGGERMKAAGVDIRSDITSRSTIGIFEAIRHIPSHLRAIKNLKRMMEKEKPDALILIDAQGFNMPLASMAKAMGIRTIYYVAPQEWLWGTEKGVSKVANTIDLIVSIFSREHEKFRSAGGNSVYFGHPLVDIAKKTMEKQEFIRMNGLDPAKKLIALCPGSRKQELKTLLPILIGTARKLKQLIPEIQFVLPLSSTVFRDQVKGAVSGSGLKILIIENDNYNVLGNSDLAIAASGTIVLESAILGTPVIMLYKLSLPTYIVGKYLLKIKLPYYSMPNILAGRKVIPEFVMSEAKVENLVKEAVRMIGDEPVSRKMKDEFNEIRASMGEPGMIAKIASSVVDFASGKRA